MSYILREEDIANKEMLYVLEGSDEHLCPICQNILVEPKCCTSCQRSFCSACINEWKKKTNECPFRCKDFTLGENRILKKLLAKLKFKCINGCGIIFDYEEAKNHYTKNCPKITSIRREEDIELLKKELNELKLENQCLKRKITMLTEENQTIKKENLDLKNQLKKEDQKEKYPDEPIENILFNRQKGSATPKGEKQKESKDSKESAKHYNVRNKININVV